MKTSFCIFGEMKLFWIILFSFLNVTFGRHLDCERPPYVEHATSTSVNEEEDIITVRYACNHGYRLVGHTELQCDLDSDEWQQEPPSCEMDEQITSDTTSDPETPSASAGTSHNDETDNTNGNGMASRKKKKTQEILEDTQVSSEFAKDLDLSCMIGRTLVRAPNIENGYIVKYNRRKKGEIVFLVSFYECDENYELEDINQDRLYCSNEKWVGTQPVCMSISGDYNEEDTEDSDNEEDYNEEENDPREEERRRAEAARAREEEERRHAERNRVRQQGEGDDDDDDDDDDEEETARHVEVGTREDEEHRHAEDNRVREEEERRRAEMERARGEEERARAEQERLEEERRFAEDVRHREEEEQRRRNEATHGTEVEHERRYDETIHNEVGSEEERNISLHHTYETHHVFSGGERNDDSEEETDDNRSVEIQCGPDRGGCDHECRMIKHPRESEPRVECSCFTGFTLDPNDSRRCNDIDECQLNNGGCAQNCINQPGSFECSCQSGLQIDLTGKGCVDINECLLRNGHGPCQDTCTNIWGSYICSCDGLPRTRLTNDNHTCEDAGECGKNNGGCSHKCLTTLGRVFCLCPDGYLLAEDWKTCQDINECDDPEIASRCQYGCENLSGSFRCKSAPVSKSGNDEYDDDDEDDDDEEGNGRDTVRQPHLHEECRDGFRRDDYGECIDINECLEGTTGCQHCENAYGGFQCTCPDGYELGEDEKTCFDINECQNPDEDGEGNGESYRICSHDCINLEGSFRCLCPSNSHLHSDNRTCIRDFCEDLQTIANKTDCSHFCEDEQDGFLCKCPFGMNLDNDLKTCVGHVTVTEDECSSNNGHHMCMPGSCQNIAGGFRCVCPAGYIEKANRCHDIDECQAGTHQCSHFCNNNEGSYECSCPHGYRLSEPDLRTCSDINECDEDLTICGSYICKNTNGSFECGCLSGQELLSDGGCGQSDACANGNGGCSHKCTSHHGFVECSCPLGLMLSPDSKTCLEYNPCLQNNGGCSQICDPRSPDFCSCHVGFKLLSDGRSCVDNDECKENNGGCHQICENTEGSYKCLCKTGFKMLNNSCVDIDECVLNLHNCDSVQTCVNTLGSYSCHCPHGFELDLTLNKCLDINECLTQNGNCSHNCNNIAGGYHCSCPIGYVLGDDRHKCDFINECEVNNGGCSNICHSLYGVTTCACPPGYGLDESLKKCIDINECSRNNGGCSHQCENHHGSFACSCPFGYLLELNNLTCADFDECIENNGNCSNICINLLGSYSCTCESGYQLSSDLHTCRDRDECHERIHDCSHQCINVPGTYECACPPGFNLGRDHFNCEDVNECEEHFNGGCSDRCINTAGSFHCECSEGHYLGSDNRTCQHIDECSASRRCSHECTNIPGGFKCLCPYGMQLAEDQFTCIDLDLCRSSRNNGGCSHLCENFEGSFRCRCPNGYELGDDQKSCEDINECDNLNGGCTQRCINFNGGHSCECIQGYILHGDGHTCESDNPCQHGNGGCSQICEQTRAGLICSCRQGFMLDPRDNRTCNDIDECRYSNDCQQKCQNTIGSFECVCHPGYTKDAFGNCVDINECEVRNGGCSAMAECINLPGAFKCSCGNGYKLSSDKMTCLEIKDNCIALPAPINGDIHCTRSRHKTELFYKTKCSVWCKKGYILQGPSVRLCNGTGQWDSFENSCVPQSCPPLPKPAHGTILPATCLLGQVFPGERCTLQCESGYKPAGKRATVCDANQMWTLNSTFNCIPVDIKSDAIRPYIKCPRDTVLILPKDQKTVHIRLEQPKTNVEYWKYVDSYPEWAKNLEAHLGAGEHVIKFRARSPNSNLNAVCRSVITVKVQRPPTVTGCPTSFDVQLNQNEQSRSITWKEPVFHGHLKQVYKSKIPGDQFTPGVHSILYVATDRDGQTSRCEFKIIVRAYQHQQQQQQQPPEVRASYAANRLENHESYLVCPGKEALKIETNYPIHLPVGCYVKNVLINPFNHHHRRRHHGVDNMLRYYSSWDDPNFLGGRIRHRRGGRWKNNF